jgi:hypothetical protein
MKTKRAPRILARFPQWSVTSAGLECTAFPYEIGLDQLFDGDWLDHMAGKTWVNMAAFAAALDRARELHAAARADPRAIVSEGTRS